MGEPEQIDEPDPAILEQGVHQDALEKLPIGRFGFCRRSAFRAGGTDLLEESGQEFPGQGLKLGMMLNVIERPAGLRCITGR